MSTNGNRAAVVTGSASLLIAVGFWWWLGGVLDPMRMPTVQAVSTAALQLVSQGYAGGTLIEHTLHSVKLALLGFTVASVTAIPIGLAMGMNRYAEAIFSPLVSFLRPIPPLAWIPLAIIWFGLGDGAKIFVIWFTAFMPTLINTFVGVRSVERTLLLAARVHGARRRDIVLDVVLPGAAPMVFSGLRVSLQASWMALVAAELIGAFFGLGKVLMTAAQDIYPGMIVVAMVAVSICGAGMTFLLGLLERYLLPWRRTNT
ncbi:ABC transporter permease [Paraburkholderia caribensis]|uniref:ABC transporter permease n=1 Tax=Paraburkholderia TaxID=1822464 RepID=UPI001CB22A58|nr:ABC transporter permease [Paraburkholderia caribensis]BEU25636.1 ABC transporter permease [Paraburkholderia sp. 22B1P]CAG9262456.1 ABC-type nitrate/sulfonate/bicarbonate transport system, permease component [Paraburkholderia caribensis]